MRLERYGEPTLPPPPYRSKFVFKRQWKKPLTIAVVPSDTSYDWSRGKTLLERLPFEGLIQSSDRLAPLLLVYLQGLIEWTRSYSEPDGRRWQDHFPHEFASVLSRALGRLAWLIRHLPISTDVWAPLRRFEERDREFELTGDFVEGLADALIRDGGVPDSAFWALWNPPSRWIMDNPRNSAASGRDTDHFIEGPVAAAGFVGPYSSPFPPDWPHLDSVLPVIDVWAQETEGSASATRLLLHFADRLTAAQIETWVLPWLERRVARHRAAPAFWEQGENGDRAALLLRCIAASPELRRRLRIVLGAIADAGSLAAREQIIQLSGRS